MKYIPPAPMHTGNHPFLIITPAINAVNDPDTNAITPAPYAIISSGIFPFTIVIARIPVSTIVTNKPVTIPDTKPTMYFVSKLLF